MQNAPQETGKGIGVEKISRQEVQVVHSGNDSVGEKTRGGGSAARCVKEPERGQQVKKETTSRWVRASLEARTDLPYRCTGRVAPGCLDKETSRGFLDGFQEDALSLWKEGYGTGGLGGRKETAGEIVPNTLKKREWG